MFQIGGRLTCGNTHMTAHLLPLSHNVFSFPAFLTALLPLYSHYTALRTDPGNSHLTIKAHLLPVSTQYTAPCAKSVFETATISPCSMLHALCSLSFSLSLQSPRFNHASETPILSAIDTGNRSTSHAYHLCQLAHGRPAWTTGDQYKRCQFFKL